MEVLKLKIILFREAVRKRRLELKMSQKELALKVGYRSGATISEIERGVTEPPYEKVEAFAEALKTTPEQLISPIEKTGKLLELVPQQDTKNSKLKK